MTRVAAETDIAENSSGHRDKMSQVQTRTRLMAAVVAGAGLVLSAAVGSGYAGALIEFDNVRDHGPERLLGYLARPEGSGPFPAVVVLHGCGGLSAASAGVADELTSIGYVALAVDSLGSRHQASACGRLFVGQETDAYAALEYLSQQSFVDPARIAVLGNSMGGSSALLAVQRGWFDRYKRKFGAAIAYYPSCNGLSPDLSAPALILIGGADELNSPEACRQMISQPHRDAVPIDLVVYPGVHHGFNFPQLKPGTRTLGRRLEYNEQAATDAWEKVRGFLAAKLAGSR
jgi:dienelactone hydrolase